MHDKKIKFIDVGQGDCMLLQSESEISGEPLDTFIDAGNGSRDVSEFTQAECINLQSITSLKLFYHTNRNYYKLFCASCHYNELKCQFKQLSKK